MPGRLQQWLYGRGRRLLTARGPGDYDVAEGLRVMQKDGAVDALHLWAGVFLAEHPATEVAVTITVTPVGGGAPVSVSATLEWFSMRAEATVSGWPDGRRFFHGHHTVAGLPPDTWFDVQAVVDDADVSSRPTAECRARTLPAALPPGSDLRVVAGSCYDFDTDDDDRVDAAYRRAFPGETGPDLTWLVGDQIYADTPIYLYGLLARETPRTYTFLEYWAAWGMQAPPGQTDENLRRRPGIGALLCRGPNWFLPDDHEFWNNWPHTSVTFKHSGRNQLKGIRGAVTRLVRGTLPDHLLVRPDDDPGRAPDGSRPGDRVRQTHLPVHPDEWDQWGRGAFDLFGSFQTRSVLERATGSGIAHGERDDPAAWHPDDPGAGPEAVRPPGGGPRGVVHQPITPVVQRLDLDPVQVVFLDTRTRRTRSVHHEVQSRFVDDTYLDEVLAVARDAPILVLVLPEPVLRAPHYLTSQRRGEPWLAGDIGIHHYWWQYEEFWDGLVAARRDRPTVTIGGDIHRSYVAHAPQLSLVEIVASPMSLVYGFYYRDLVSSRLARWQGKPDEYGPDGPGFPRSVAELMAGPRKGVDGVSDGWTPPRPQVGPAVRSLAHIPFSERRNAFAVLDLRRDAEHPDQVQLDVALHRVDDESDPVGAGLVLDTAPDRDEGSVRVRWSTHPVPEA